MLYFSSLLKTINEYKPAAERLFAALSCHNVDFCLLDGTRDIWLRDFMPIKTKSGKYVSFRYEPNYLEKYKHLQTYFKLDINDKLSLPNLIYSNINLDGGNVVFSPSKQTAIMSDRIFEENENKNKTELLQELEQLLETQIIIVPSLKSDMTGHADGMVRFVDECTVIVNDTPYKNGLEQRIAKKLKECGINTIPFSYFGSSKNNAVGCYINYLETKEALFLPVFDVDMDSKAINTAKHIFNKTIVPVNINEIAKDGGVLNCISWEN
ncbi:MAG: agmatine deiminase family protein [Acetobacter sp.]|nr:agmatine deiminase family protein [Bacteroides sp.]MCM1341684.1 agmatine deiminase family protein [Acetobacter sp.]MCM1432378.1 agmatine deiminase family protein [Clostridiales bacterium]